MAVLFSHCPQGVFHPKKFIASRSPFLLLQLISCLSSLVCAEQTQAKLDHDLHLLFDPETKPLSPVIPRDFVGLSFEWNRAAPLAKSVAFAKLLEYLVEPTSNTGPLVAPMSINLRVGGNSADRSRWGKSDAYNTSNNFNADTILSLYRTIRQIPGGKSTLTLDLTMRQPNRTKWAVEEWKGITDTLAGFNDFDSILESIEVGNEGDLYGSHNYRPKTYSPHDYEQEYNAYLHDLDATYPIKGKIQGGTFCCMGNFVFSQTKMMRRFRSFASSWSFHKYPTSTCLNKTTSIAELLSDASSDKLGTYFQQFTVPAVKMGLKARVGETNSASCGGSFGVSDTMASALWSLDYLFALATHQVSRVNFHGGNSGPYTWFSVVDDKSNRNITAGSSSELQVRPLYYGMFVWNWMVANHTASRVLPVECQAGRLCHKDGDTLSFHRPPNKTFAVRAKSWALGDTSRGDYKVIILNKLLGEEAMQPLWTRMKAPFDKAEIVILESRQGMTATRNISFAGWTWEGTQAGERKGSYDSTILYPTDSNGKYNIFEFAQAPATALVISFNQKTAEANMES